MEDFDSKYTRVVAEIQEDAKLVREMYGLAREKGLRRKGHKMLGDERQVYFPVGKIGEIPLGLDLNLPRVRLSFETILSNMRLVYEESSGELDILRVCAKLESGLGIVSEDLTDGGRLKVVDDASLLDPIVDGVFGGFANDVDDLGRAVLLVPEKKREVVADLDHLTPRDEFEERMVEYRAQYSQDERFMIREV